MTEFKKGDKVWIEDLGFGWTATFVKYKIWDFYFFKIIRCKVKLEDCKRFCYEYISENQLIRRT